MSITNAYAWGPENKAKVKQIVMMLHGVGSNGQDLMSIAPYWAQTFTEAMFISPDAPFECDMAPPGFPNSYQWFSLQDRDPDAMIDGVQNVFPMIEDFIDEKLQEFGIAPENLVLMGFSQGTMTSLYVAPRLKYKIGGVLGYSGALIWDGLSVESGLQNVPIHLIHGEADDVVPVEQWQHAKDTLEQAGFTVTGHTTPGLSHTLDHDGVDSGAEFMKKIYGIRKKTAS